MIYHRGIFIFMGALHMYEVEKNFNLTPEEKDRLLEGAEFVGEKTITDVYFDTPTFDLTKRDIWLRKRDGKFEVKIPAEPPERGRRRKTDRYLEVEDEEGIRRELALPEGESMDDSAERAGYSPFCVCTTVRESYRKEGFNIVIDHVTYSDVGWSYDTSEIERMVAAADEMAGAADAVMAFAERHGLKAADAPGKVIEYLRRHRRDQYRTLVESGTIYDPGA